MLSRPLFLFILLFSYLGLFAQEEAASHFLLKTSLSSFIPDYCNSGKIQLEFEKPLAKNQSILMQAAYIFSYGPSIGPNLESFTYQVGQEQTVGYKIGVEYRKYLNRHKVIQPLCLLIWPLVLQLHSIENPNSGLYMSGQLNFQQTEILTRNYMDQSSQIYSVDRYTPTFLVRIGFQSLNKNNFAVDQSLGFGIQYVSCVSNQAFDKSLIMPYATSTISSLFLAINYSLKIGFGF